MFAHFPVKYETFDSLYLVIKKVINGNDADKYQYNNVVLFILFASQINNTRWTALSSDRLPEHRQIGGSDVTKTKLLHL